MARQSVNRGNLVDSVFSLSVLASCCIMRTLVAGFQASLGLLFVKWEIYFGVSATTTAWIGSSYMLILHLTGTYQKVEIFIFSLKNIKDYEWLLMKETLKSCF